MLGGVLLGLGASACWAIANVAVQSSARRVGALRALLWAVIVGLALVALLAPVLDTAWGAPRAADLLWLGGAGAAALLAYVCMFYAFEHGRLTIAVPVVSSWAVLSSALSLILLRERLRPTQLVGAAAVLSGALMVSRFVQQSPHAGGATGGAASQRWLAAAVGAAVGFGLLVPAISRLAPTTGALGTVGAVYAVALALGLPLAWRARVSLRPPPASALAPIALAGLFESGGFTCITLAARRAPVAVVSPVASLASALTVLYAWLVLKDRPQRPSPSARRWPAPASSFWRSSRKKKRVWPISRPDPPPQTEPSSVPTERNDFLQFSNYANVKTHT